MSKQNKVQEKKTAKTAITILNVAQSLFAQRGYKATSISEIANRVGVSKANIYHHFKSKEHLYQEALKFACEQVFNILNLNSSSDTEQPKIRLQKYVELHLKSMLEHPISTNLIKRELMDNNQINGEMLAQSIFTNIFLKVSSLVFDAQDKEVDPANKNTALQAFAFVALNMFFFDSQSVMKYLPGVNSFSDSPESFSRKIFEIIINT